MNEPNETVKTETPSAVASSDGLGVNRVGNAILCIAWGEQDRPDATLARTALDVENFIVGEWIGDPEDPLVAEVLKELAEHDWRDDGELKYEFEVGGCSFQDVVDVTPNAPAQPPRIKGCPCANPVLDQSGCANRGWLEPVCWAMLDVKSSHRLL